MCLLSENLSQIYGELADVLHLQDWQGTLTVIYKVITNHHIFKNTALLVSTIIQGVKSSTEPENIKKISEENSRVFWCSAKSEFRERMAEESKILEEVRIPLVKPVVDMFKQRISTEDNRLTTELKELITSQTIFPSAAHRQKLFHISLQETEQLLQKYNCQPKRENDLQERQNQAIKFLQALHEIKIDLARRGQFMKLLEEPTPKISARLLLETMFSIVTQRMHLRKWGKMPVDELNSLKDTIGEIPSEKTCLDYQTVMAETVIDDS